MNKLLILALCLGPSAVVAQQPTLKPVDEKNGFRDAHLGDTITLFKGLQLVENSGASKFYKRSSDKLLIGNYPLKEIVYAFYKGRLYNIILKTQGRVNSQGVLDVLVAQYGGYSDRPNQFLEEYWWFGTRVSMNYNENSVTHDARITMMDNAISDRKVADKKANDQKATSDL